MSFKHNADNAKYEVGSDNLPSGLYLITIIRCTENEKPANGKNARFEFDYDIAEGEYTNFFSDMYESFRSRSSNAYWQGSFMQGYKGKSACYMDALINRFKDANRSFRYRDDGGRCFEGFKLVASIQAVEREYNGYKSFNYQVKNLYSPKEVSEEKDLNGNPIRIMKYEDKLLPVEKPKSQQRNYDINDNDIQF